MTKAKQQNPTPDQLSITDAEVIQDPKPSTEVATTQGKPLAVWQQQLVKAEHKMLAIDDAKRVKQELGFAVQLIQNNDALKNCNPATILDAVINVSRTGITLNPVMKLAHLIPRDGKCVLDFDYKGLVWMLKKYGCIKHIDAYIVYNDEEFEEDRVNNTIKHVVNYAETEEAQKARSVKGAYTRTILPDGSVVYSPLIPKWEIDRIRKTSKSAHSGYSPWNTFPEEMIKKTAIKRAFKLLISGNPTEQLTQALLLEEGNHGLSEEAKQGQAKSSIEAMFGED